MSELVRLNIDSCVARITMRDVAGRNAIGLAMADALLSAVERALADPSAWVILLDAEGPYFSVGGHLREMRDAGDESEAHVARIARPVHTALHALTQGPLPVVSVWSGMAAGGGIGFALCGDIVLAGASAQLTPGFTRSGLTPDTGLTWLLPRVLGHARAFEILALNPVIDAAKAMELGLVNRVVADEALADEAMRIAAELAALPTGVLTATKRLMRQADAASFGEAMTQEPRSIARRAALPDTRERLARFFAG